MDLSELARKSDALQRKLGKMEMGKAVMEVMVKYNLHLPLAFKQEVIRLVEDTQRAET